MGNRRALAALVLAGALSGASAPGGLREAQWIASEARFQQLSNIDPPCIANYDESPLPGAVAFEDPLLLGGQAARAGLSCASCHRGGRGNPAFVFPGISGAAGTADVTASLLSSHRGDGLFNPRPIPDLTFDKRKVADGDLETFIRGLIVEEFEGPEPPPKLLASLTAYVRALDPAACKAARPRDALYDLARYAMALELAIDALDAGERDLALTMLRAARSRLGMVAERYGESARVTRSLEDADAALKSAQEELRSQAASSEVREALHLRHALIVIWSAPILEAEGGSLYNPERLAAALNAARTP